VAKFTRRGRFDPTFGTGGPIYFAGDTSYSEFSDVQVDSAGGILAVGSAQYGASTSQVVLLRYRKDGTQPKGFGEDGVGRATLGGQYDELQRLDIAPDGGLVAVGTAVSGGRTIDSSQLAVVKWQGG
jgi:hypothetical protein